MKYHRSRKRRIVGAAGICILLLFGLGMAVYSVYALQEKEKLVKTMSQQLRIYEKELYVAVRDLQAGEPLTDACVKKEIRYSDEERTLYISEEDFGKVFTAEVKQGTCLMTFMLGEKEADLREVFVTQVAVPEYLETGDRVDVRISFGNAEDYIVLAEKRLISCDTKKGIVLEMTEEEILRLSSAQHDCKLYMDTGLYLVKYPEQRQMPKSNVNYPANREILLQMGCEETIERRNRLEERIQGLKGR